MAKPLSEQTQLERAESEKKSENQVPLTRTVRHEIAKTAAGSDSKFTIVAPISGKVTSVTYYPSAEVKGGSEERVLKLVNRGSANLGSAVCAERKLTGNLPANEAIGINLTGTLANREVTSGDTLVWESLHESSGKEDPGGEFVVKVSNVVHEASGGAIANEATGYIGTATLGG